MQHNGKDLEKRSHGGGRVYNRRRAEAKMEILAYQFQGNTLALFAPWPAGGVGRVNGVVWERAG